MEDKVKIGDQAFLVDGGEEFGAIRAVEAHRVLLYVENAGEFEVGNDAITAVHFGKVIFNFDKLGHSLQKAIGRAHDAED